MGAWEKNRNWQTGNGDSISLGADSFSENPRPRDLLPKYGNGRFPAGRPVEGRDTRGLGDLFLEESGGKKPRRKNQLLG